MVGAVGIEPTTLPCEGNALPLVRIAEVLGLSRRLGAFPNGRATQTFSSWKNRHQKFHQFFCDKRREFEADLLAVS
jgi:hypothetical protein